MLAQTPTHIVYGPDDPLIPSLLSEPFWTDPNWDPFKDDPFFNDDPDPFFHFPLWPDGVTPSFPQYSPSFPTEKDPPVVVEAPPIVIIMMPPKKPKKPGKHGKPPKTGVP